jgi:hypothetical protein
MALLHGRVPDGRDDLERLTALVGVLRLSVFDAPPRPSDALLGRLDSDRLAWLSSSSSSSAQRAAALGCQEGALLFSGHGKVRRRTVAGWFAGLGIAAQIVIGAGAVTASAAGLGMAGALPPAAQQFFEDAVTAVAETGGLLGLVPDDGKTGALLVETPDAVDTDRGNPVGSAEYEPIAAVPGEVAEDAEEISEDAEGSEVSDPLANRTGTDTVDTDGKAEPAREKSNPGDSDNAQAVKNDDENDDESDDESDDQSAPGGGEKPEKAKSQKGVADDADDADNSADSDDADDDADAGSRPENKTAKNSASKSEPSHGNASKGGAEDAAEPSDPYEELPENSESAPDDGDDVSK